MASMVEDRIAVGTCKLGDVFIFHRAEQDGYTGKPVNDTWTVRAGNHTVGTYSTELGAKAVAHALCEDAPAAPAEDVPAAIADTVEAVRKKVSKG